MDIAVDTQDLIALVVEDSAVQRRHMASLMRTLKFGTVLEACDGHDALRVLDQIAPRPIHLVVTDIDMPGMDGIELIGRLAERRQIENLIVTSARDPRLLETVESLLADTRGMRLLGAVAKPVTSVRLVRLLQDAAADPAAGCGRPVQRSAASLDEIGRALEAKQFVPFVQPKVAVRSGRLEGVEALARWQHPHKGLLAPQHFIPLIEGTPLMAKLTLTMVEQALGHLCEWRRSMPALALSLNLSADDLSDHGFVDRLTELVQRHGIEPAALTWEVTETTLMGKRSMANLARLALKGFGLSMDDYGIGYSSMQTLSRSPFTELKIDRAFVNGAGERTIRRAILNNSLELARSLHIATVAEGVESEADWNLLHELGCDLAQGYLIARPMPCGELLAWTMSQRTRLRALAAAPERQRATPGGEVGFTIAASDPLDVRFWSVALDVDEATLREAVGEVGRRLHEVTGFLKARRERARIDR